MAGGHDHHQAMSGGTLRTAFLLTIVIFAVEASAGLLSHSLALLSDAGHVLTDIVALGLAWLAATQAERPADARNTYGYHRTGILAALVNAVMLMLIVLVIAFEAVRRLSQPQAVTPWLMFVSASIGILINLYIGIGLRGEAQHSLNVRAAMLHVFGDIGASAGVIVAGAVILITGWYPADPILSLAIACLIAFGAWRILRDTVDILMEATPRDVNLAQLVRDLVKAPGVQDVHDLHVWSLAGGMLVLSAHVQVNEDCSLSRCDELQGRLNTLLQRDYGIGHSTLQFERAACHPNPLYCSLNGSGESVSHNHADHPGHDHPPTAESLAGDRTDGTAATRSGR